MQLIDVDSFLKCQDLFKKYREEIYSNPELWKENGYYTEETRDRLEQLLFLLEEIKRREEIIFKEMIASREEFIRVQKLSKEKNLSPEETLLSSKIPTKREILENLKNTKEYYLFSECFYYIAHRTLKAIQKLPGLKKVDSPGIRDVRNHLMEHPIVFSRSIGWRLQKDEFTGAIIKSSRQKNETDLYIDKGLHFNLKEFTDSFMEKMSIYLENN